MTCHPTISHDSEMATNASSMVEVEDVDDAR